MKRNLAIVAALAAAGLSLKLQLALGLRWQEAAGSALGAALVAAAMLAFIALEAWASYTAALVPVVLYDAYRLVHPPLPGSLTMMYTVMAMFGVVLYLSVVDNQLKALGRGFLDLLASPAAGWARWAVLALAPLWLCALVLARSFPELLPPMALRTVHPEPPGEITVKGKPFDMVGGTNPFRKYKGSDPKKWEELVAEGKAVYYKNCFYCHGDNLNGRGHFASGVNPLPANFQDVGTIAMLQESFVFWRVAKGGPGMPKAGHPWASAMPVWEDMLGEDEMWKAVLYIYEATGREPRTFAPTHEEGH